MAYILDGGPQTGGLREEIDSVILLHTSENAPRTSCLALAVYIRDRRNIDGSYGSYHSLSDCFGDGMQLAGLSLKVWHAPALNGSSLSHSFVTRAADWNKLPKQDRENILRSGAERCHKMSRWLVSQGKPAVQARLLNAEQAKAGYPGFTTHAAVQPVDRTDPGRDFPWDEFFAYFRSYERGAAGVKPVAAEKSAHKG